MYRIRSLFAFTLLACLSTLSAQEQVGHQQPVYRLLPELTKFIKDALAKTHVPGAAVGVVYRDQVIYLQGFGVRKIGAPDPVTADTVFQLASVSKPLASTVVANAVGDGLVDWDDRIAELDPSFHLSEVTASAQVTVRDMLSHRSGLPQSAGDVLEELSYSRPEILSRMRLLPLTGQVGKTYAYSNFPFTEGGLASVKRSRETWEEYAERHLFRPLGMTSTSYRWSDFAARTNKSSLHVILDGEAQQRYERTDTDDEAPAGGASSNVRDMAQWLRLQLGKGRVDGNQIIPVRALAETHKPQVVKGTNGSTGKPSYYGLGWDVDYDADGNLVLSHSGAFRVGASTTILLQPSLQLGIVILTNAQPVGFSEAVSNYFFDLVKEGKPQKDWLQIFSSYFKASIGAADTSPVDYEHLDPPSSPAPAQPLSAYTGRYQNPYYGAIEVFIQRNQLFLRLPARSNVYALQHWDGDTFTFRYEAESGIGLRGLTFNYQGNSNQLAIDKFMAEYSGVFTEMAQ